MGNTNVIYIDYLESYVNVCNFRFSKWVKKIMYKILNYFGYVKVENNYFVIMCVENECINKRMLNNLIKKMKAVNAKNIVFAEKLLQNSEFLNIFEKDFNILDGKWLYKFLIFDIIQKISLVQSKKIDEYEITILCNNPTEIVLENIQKLSRKCKILNILTVNNVEKFAHIEKELYEKYGLLLNVSTNMDKVCLFSDIVVNIDFNMASLQKCGFNDKSVLIQCTKEKVEKDLKAIITFYRLSLNKTYIGFYNKMKHFEEEILYESLLYYNMSLEGMKKFLIRDNVKVKSFEGLHGKINFNELR